ncbi:MAG TPA: STAS domain-containing protein [Gaiella sp.]|nr:STAS domain-containing protein [Gaiella sp.]
MGGEAGRVDRPNDVEDVAFAVETEDVSDRVSVVEVHGQADLHTASELRTAMTDAIDRGAVSLVVDLSEATFIDSMTLGVLLGAVKRLRPVGGTVSVVCTDPHIRRVFEITLLDRVFTLHSDRAAAVDGAGAG